MHTTHFCNPYEFLILIYGLFNEDMYKPYSAKLQLSLT